MTAPRPVLDRLLDRVVIDDNGCWIFTGAKTAAGYGAIGLGSRDDGTEYTHRLTYSHYVGPIPEGFQVDHLCRIRACCNPVHLEAVSQPVNNRRALAVRPAKTHCKHQHEFTPDNTGRNSKGNRYCRTCLADRNARRSAAA